MKLTLLEVVQDMLTAIDSENVADVGDTEEAGMCVAIANMAFEDIITRHRWRHLRTYAQLSTSANLNEMTCPSGTIALDPYNVYYKNSDGNFNPVTYLSPEVFLARTITRNSSDANITVINNIRVFNDREPTLFTSDDDETLRFDAIPDSVSGLSGTNTMVIAWVAPTSRLTTSAQIFNLPSVVFPAFRNYCVGLAIKHLKGDDAGAQVVLRESTKQLARLTQNARLVDVRDDVRKYIIPRRSYKNVVNNLRNTGNGFI